MALLSPSLEKMRAVSSGQVTIRRRETTRIDWLSLWILFSAWCPFSGWGLSLLHCLNVVGVIISLFFFIGALALLAKPWKLIEKSKACRWRLIRSRWILPRLWITLTILAFIGGIAYTPNNYDYLTYRFPRLLNWCWEQGWFWIPTVNRRMNFSATQFEWMMAPLFILFKTDRLFFLINIASYLFVPTLIFSVFKELGISKRIGWWWMWVLPCGYCYILQAASLGNDSFAVTYFLASLHYLFRAKVSSPARNLSLSLLSIALLTAVKASNLPLVLPWLTLLYFTRESLFRKESLVLIAVMPLAMVASFLPIAYLNHHYTGDYFGDPENLSRMKVKNPINGIVGNLLQISVENLAPPMWPRTLTWNPFLPPSIKAMVDQDFPRLDLTTEEFPIEEGAGAGLGIILGVAPFLIAGIRGRISDRYMVTARSAVGTWVVAAMGAACLFYMAKIANEAASRLVAPYYALIIGGFMVLVSLDGRLIHRDLFKCAGVIAILCAFPLVILSPSRPLFPEGFVLKELQKHNWTVLVERFQAVFSVYPERAFVFKDIIPLLPPDERTIGFLATDNPCETSLWRPFGSRRLVYVTPNDSVDEVKAEGIRVLVVSQEALEYRYHTDIKSLLTKWSARLIGQKDIALFAKPSMAAWYVLDLDKS